MSEVWGAKAREVSEKATKSGLYVKWTNKGDSVSVVFLQEPVAYIDDFQGKKTSKLLFEVFDVELGARRVMDVNAKHANTWWKEIDEVGIDYVYKVELTGVGFDYSLDLRAKAKGDIKPALRGLIEGTEPIDLGAVVSKKTKGKEKGPSRYDEEHPEPEGEHPIDENDPDRIPF